MGKLRVLSGREVCDLLKENGFSFVRYGKGDHDIYQKQTDDGTITVPVLSAYPCAPMLFADHNFLDPCDAAIREKRQMLEAENIACNFALDFCDSNKYFRV